MAFSREDILNVSVREYKDKQRSCILYNTERIITSSGYMFILLDNKNKRNITASLHHDRHFDIKEVGKVSVSYITINTREELQNNDIIEYNNIKYAILKQENYNAEMDMYHYIGQTCYGYNTYFIIYDLQDIENELNLNSFELLYNMLKSIKINGEDLFVYPAFLKLENINKYLSVNKFIVIEILDTKEVNLLKRVYNQDNTSSYILNNNDKIKIRFINFNKNETYSIIGQLETRLANNGNNNIGLVSNFNIYTDKEHEVAMNLKSLINIIEFDVNYNITAKDNEEKTNKLIKQIFYQANLK